jgi:hypothetical protein
MGKDKASKAAKLTMVSGLGIALLPLALWGITSLGCDNPFSEGTCAGASALWGVILSVPTGTVVFLIGLFMWLVSRFPIQKS